MEKNAHSYSKKRIIGYTHYTERGKIPTNKNKIDGYVEYESLGEATLILLHDHDPNCYEIESQPIQIPNKSGFGKPYTIDLGVKFKDGKRVLYDVKHHTFFIVLFFPDSSNKCFHKIFSKRLGEFATCG